MKTIGTELNHLPLKELLLYLLAIICHLASITAIFLSIYIEPRGEVHNSILTYFGISCGFCGSILGISTHYSNELTKFKSSVMNDINKNAGKIN